VSENGLLVVNNRHGQQMLGAQGTLPKAINWGLPLVNADSRSRYVYLGLYRGDLAQMRETERVTDTARV